MKFFIPRPETLEDLKTMYRKLAFKYHPDCGGDTEIMKAVNNEYDKLFETVKNIHRNRDGETYRSETTETPEHFKDIINALLALQMVSVEIELIGSFLWVTGQTYTYRATIKALGFKWSQNKTAWYIAPEGYRKQSKKQFGLEEIRSMYGSEKVNGERKERLKLSPDTE